MSTRNDGIRRFIEALADFGQDRLVGAMAELCGEDPVAAVVGTCSALAAWRDEGVPIAVRDRLIMQLADSEEAVALEALGSIADGARDWSMRLCALKGLAGKDLPASVVAQIRRLTERSDWEKPAKPTVRKEALRLAGAQVLGSLAEPTNEDVAAVVRLVRDAFDAHDATFPEVVEVLWEMPAEESVREMLAMAGECKPGTTDQVLLVAVLGTHAEDLDAKHHNEARKCLQHCLPSLPQVRDAVDHLVHLGQVLAETSFARQLAQQHNQQAENSPIGQVVTAVLDACQEPDAPLAHAYVCLADNRGAIAPDSACVLGLKRCAAAGLQHVIFEGVSRLNRFARLRNSGLLLEVAGGAAKMVAGLCKAIDGDRDEGTRQQLAAQCYSAIVMASVPWDSKPSIARDDFGAYRARVLPGEPGLIDEARRTPDGRSPLAQLANRACLPEASFAVVEMSKALLSEPDDLAELYRQLVLRMSAKAKVMPGGDLDRCPNLAEVEPLLAVDKCEQELIRTHVMQSGKLNRYLLGAVRRRRKGGFATIACEAVQGIDNAKDGQFVINALADEGLCDALARISGFTWHDDGLRTAMRVGALRALASLGTKDGDETTVLQAVHSRFEDNLEVRLAAYRATASIASPRSIVYLRGREGADNASEGKKVIRDALNGLSGKLREDMPPINGTPEELVKWLKYIAESGDGSFVNEVSGFLDHGDTKVVQTALETLGAIGGEPAEQAVAEYIEAKQPGPRLLSAARRALAVLRDRGDIELFERLSVYVSATSDLLDIELTNYEELIGPTLAALVAKRIAKADDAWERHEWDLYATRLCGVSESLVNFVYRDRSEILGLAEAEARRVKGTKNKLEHGAFKKACPNAAMGFRTLYDLRQISKEAHMQEEDGTEKLGLEEPDGQLARQAFGTAFEDLVRALKGSANEAAGDGA